MWDWFIYSNNGILTTDRCKPFDSAADGYVVDPAVPFVPLLTSITVSFVRGEGAVAIVIKPLEAALADNDHIYAVVRLSSLAPLTLPHWTRDRFWALPSTTTGPMRRFPSPPGSYNNSASVTPSQMPAGIPVKLIMWNFTQPVCRFQKSSPITLLTQHSDYQARRSEILLKRTQSEKFSIGTTTLSLGASRGILGMFTPPAGSFSELIR